MRAEFVLKQIAADDIEQLSCLAVEAFREDSYFREAFKADDLDSTLYDIFKQCASICLECGKVVGAFESATNTMVGFALMFDFNNVREKHPQYYKKIFPEALGLNKLSAKVEKIVGKYSEYLYILALGVSPAWRKRGVCSLMIECIKQSYVQYNFIADISNEAMYDILCSKFGFESVGKVEQLSVVRSLTNLSERIDACYSMDDVAFLAPNDFDAQLLPEVKSCQRDVEVGHLAQQSGSLHFTQDIQQGVVAQIVVGSIKTLQYWQRLINPLLVEEIVVDINGRDVLCYVQQSLIGLDTDTCLRNLSVAKQYADEFDLGCDIFTCVPIEYEQISKLVESSQRPVNIQKVVDCLTFRTDFETGVFGDYNDSDSQLSKRIERRYLGCYGLRIYQESAMSSFGCAFDDSNIISENLTIGVVVSVDRQTSCGVLHLLLLSPNVPLTQYLDSVSRNQLIINIDGESKSLFAYLEEQFAIYKRGASKNYVCLHEDRKKLDNQLLASVLYSETYYRDEEGLGQVIDPGIMDQVNLEMGLSQYNYAVAYFHRNTLVQIAPLKCGLSDRILSQTVALFYVEMVMFEESTMGSMTSKIIKFLADIDNDKTKKTLENIATLYDENAKSMAFWDLKLNYPSSMVSIDRIREAFQIEKHREQLELKKMQLLNISESHSNLNSYIESQVVSVVGALLTIISLLDCLFTPDKRIQLLVAPVFMLLCLWYLHRSRGKRKK